MKARVITTCSANALQNIRPTHSAATLLAA
jgi:hypothetical protein